MTGVKKWPLGIAGSESTVELIALKWRFGNGRGPVLATSSVRGVRALKVTHRSGDLGHSVPSVLRTTRGNNLVDVEPIVDQFVRVIPLVNDHTVVHHIRRRAALDVNLNRDRASELEKPIGRDDYLVVIRPILLVLPPNCCCTAKRFVACTPEVNVTGNQRQKTVKIAFVVAIDVHARELARFGHSYAPLRVVIGILSSRVELSCVDA